MSEDLDDTILKESTQPTSDMTPDEVSRLVEDDPSGKFYTRALRGEYDVVLSGAVIGGWGPGRYHRSKATARRFLELKYGAERVRPVGGWTRGRWAYLITGLRKDPKDLKKGVANAA